MLKVGDYIAPVRTVKPGYRYRVFAFAPRACHVPSHAQFRMVQLVSETETGDRLMPHLICESLLIPIDRTES